MNFHMTYKVYKVYKDRAAAALPPPPSVAASLRTATVTWSRDTARHNQQELTGATTKTGMPKEKRRCANPSGRPTRVGEASGEEVDTRFGCVAYRERQGRGRCPRRA